MKNRLTILILGIIILILSGCIQAPQENKPVITPVPVPVSTTIMPTEPALTPLPTPKILPSNAVYVKAYMLKPVNWGPENYELRSLKVEIINQANDPVSIRALLMSSERILEEASFTIGGSGERYQFSNQKQHFINNTNVTLRLFVKDYQPVDYEVKEASNLN